MACLTPFLQTRHHQEPASWVPYPFLQPRLVPALPVASVQGVVGEYVGSVGHGESWGRPDKRLVASTVLSHAKSGPDDNTTHGLMSYMYAISKELRQYSGVIFEGRVV